MFTSQHENVLYELNNRCIPFVVISPDNADWTSTPNRQLIKQQWFSRFILRDNSHITDFNQWLDLLKDNYDKWTSIEHLVKYHPVSFFLLNQNQSEYHI